jgi:hypothetical protein
VPLFLLRHAIELYLKSGIIIIHKRLKLPYGTEVHTTDKPRILKENGKWWLLSKTHDLAELYSYWKSLLEQHKDELTELTEYKLNLSVPSELDGWIATLAAIDPSSDYFR